MTLIASVIIGFMSLGVSIYGAFATRTMRRRHMRRLAALHGDDAAILLSIIRPFPERAPDVGAQPVDIMWRAHPFGATALALTMGVSLLGVFVIPGFILACVLLSRLDPALIPGFLGTPTRAPLDAGQIAWLVVYALIVALGVAFAVWLVVRLDPTLFFGRQFGLRATAEGIEERDQLGAHTTIAWNEIRLFEVQGSQIWSGQFIIPAIGRFAVYAPGKVISWSPMYLMTNRLPIGATAMEHAQRLAALVSLVNARTGLEPRTLSPSLQRDQ